MQLDARPAELTARQIADLLDLRQNSVSARATREEWPCRLAPSAGRGPAPRLFAIADLPPNIRAQVQRKQPRKPRKVRARAKSTVALLRERLEISTVELEDYRDGIRESGRGPDGRYASRADETAVRELSEVIELNRAALRSMKVS